ncbi:MAG: DGQHR domain-containing protein [Candidatus Pacebacteria bacterium]|nr:DGQHR domain-containing protein [Candidatus Paceibacterota bacterium]
MALNELKMAKQTEQQKKEKRLSKNVSSTFNNAGFTCVGKTKDIEVIVDGQKSDFDNIFYYENNIIFIEETTNSTSEHVRKKYEFYMTCCNNKNLFLNELKSKFPGIRKIVTQHTPSELNFIYVYTSLNSVDCKYQTRYKEIFFWDIKQLLYFLTLSSIIQKTSKYEIFTALGIPLGQQISTSTSRAGYDAMILPQVASGFPDGYQIFSFFIDPENLLQQAYVLRKYAWLDADHLYQRILVKNKINEMRGYLVNENRTFLNNIIATLPDDVKIDDDKGHTIADASKLRAGDRVKIHIPVNSNNIGIIDGQHRIFAYHEGDDVHEAKISKIRSKRHLLITAILYPTGISQKDKEAFEAKLFLEINDKQTPIKSSLKHVIYTVVDPFSDIAISKRIVQELSKNAPMNEVFETNYFDKGKLSTTSIVSYGIKYLAKLDGTDSLFCLWTNPKKDDLKKRKSHKLLDAYISFSATQLSIFLSGFKSGINKAMWTHDQKISKVLTATSINGLIHCLRLLIQNGKTGDFLYYNKKFKNIEKIINFSPGQNAKGEDYFPYKSSHWKALGEEIYNKCF